MKELKKVVRYLELKKEDFYDGKQKKVNTAWHTDKNFGLNIRTNSLFTEVKLMATNGNIIESNSKEIYKDIMTISFGEMYYDDYSNISYFTPAVKADYIVQITEYIEINKITI